MIIEYAQILSAAHHVSDGDQALTGIYKLTHKNHPSAIWIRESVEHYNYVLTMALELCNMYTAATGKTHKTHDTLVQLLQPPVNIENKPFKVPPVAAPNSFKMLVVLGKTTEHAYQEYLKSKFEEWLNRDKPLKVAFCCGDPEWLKGGAL
tara:strand:+ start:90340 stop:90789 length:450 start_codon:yes stop_codon:yes gene_type:complete